MVGWSTFRGHACSTGAHRQVRGLVRASLKREQRKEMHQQLSELNEKEY